MEVRIIHSPRRQKTVSARMTGGVMVVRAPLGMPEKELQELIGRLRAKLMRSQTHRAQTYLEDLKGAFDRLNRRYFDGALRVKSIDYSVIQRKRYGSCSPSAGTIRISQRLHRMPRWVRDYVIVHEMAHLIEASHNKAFWDLVNRYRLAERARGFLMAKDYTEDEPPLKDDVQRGLFDPPDAG